MKSRKPPETTPTAIPARRKDALKRRLPHPATVLVWDGGFMEVQVDKPSASLTACTSPLVITSGKTEKLHGASTHAGPDFYRVYHVCNGFEFGGLATCSFIKTKDGHSFTGIMNFCWIRKCSDGRPSTSFTTLSGAITTMSGIATLEMVYDCSAFCGPDVVCLEEGSFLGSTYKAVPDPLHADFFGVYEWTLTCCPDVAWNHSIAPV